MTTGHHVLHSQTAYHHISDKGIYNFLDELASMHIIDLTTAVKPYSRMQIFTWLEEAHDTEGLSLVQYQRIRYWLKEFEIECGNVKRGHLGLWKSDTHSVHLIPPEVSYQDTMFSALIRPLYGFRHFSGGNVDFWNTYGGAEAITYVDRNWSAYMSLRDNYQSGQRLSHPNWYTQELGGNYKSQTGGGQGGEFSEMRAGVTYSWRWGNFGLLKDHLCWGDNQNGSNILSGRTPSYPMIKLHLHPAKWVEFHYHHGWLVSQAIDSVASYFPTDGPKRTVQRKKYIAANMFVIKPFKRLHFSLGNSIVYGDMDVQPAYLIPFAFYKSIVHSTHWGSSFQNNALFVNISSRQIKHLHLYATYFVDEFSIRRVTDPNRHNFTSFKGGMSVTDWPVRDIMFGAEYTRTNPITFLHDEPTTSYQSNRYNLGHYLTDNAEEYFATFRWYPMKTLQFAASYTHARKGNYYEYIRGQSNPKIDELPVLEDIIWEQKSLGFHLTYYALSNFRLFASYTFSNVTGKDADGRTAEYYLNRFSPKYLHGKHKILELGFGLGF
jgi:hypothetical protein